MPPYFFFKKKKNAQCGNTALEILAVNRVKAGILNSGDLFHNKENSSEAFSEIFTVLYNSGEKELSTILSGGLWLSGLDQDSNLMTACQLNGGLSFSEKKFDFWSGPINDLTNEPFINGCDNFDIVWKVSREDILQIIEDFSDNGTIDLPLPLNIKKWPARGNIFFETEMGFPLPDQDLAPFFDSNNNGIYEPLNGEYPALENDIPSAVPDEMTWCVFNDIQDKHMETGGQPLGVEVHLLAYAFNCTDNELLNHTIFTKYKIIKKSGEDLSEFRASLFTNPNLGCPLDDFFGCDTTLNTFYIYNEDNLDSFPNSLCEGEINYGNNPPVQAITLLNKKMNSLSAFYDNWCSLPGAMRYPQTAAEFFNFTSGKWGDGSPLYYGDIGHNLTSETVNHLFFDNPNQAGGWSSHQQWSTLEGTCQSHPIIGLEPITFYTEDSFQMDFAYSFHRHPDSSHIGNVNVALENIPSIQNFYDNNFNNGCTQIATAVDEHIYNNKTVQISPNPNNGNFSIFSENNSDNISLAIFDINGKKIWNGNMPAGKNKMEINMGENLRSGIYILKAVREDGAFTSQKLLVE